MMLPILISVSVAPGSYLFWARAPLEVAAKAMTAVENAAIRNFCPESMISPLLSVSSQFTDQVMGAIRHLTRAVRDDENDHDQDDAEHRAGQTLGDSFGDVGNLNDDSLAGQRSRSPA